MRLIDIPSETSVTVVVDFGKKLSETYKFFADSMTASIQTLGTGFLDKKLNALIRGDVITEILMNAYGEEFTSASNNLDEIKRLSELQSEAITNISFTEEKTIIYNKQFNTNLNWMTLIAKSPKYWKEISKDCQLSEEFIDAYQDELDWLCICRYQKLSEDFIRCHINKIKFGAISQYQKLSEDFIRDYKNKVDWKSISTYQTLSEDFIREFHNKVNWFRISSNQKLSENFIREFKDKVDWDCISYKQQTLSEDFIREFHDKVHWNTIFIYQKLTPEFKEEFKDKIR
jgi:hypothetical protein